LSEILAGESIDDTIWGIEADCETLTAPALLKRASFVYENGPTGLSEHLMDAIVSFQLAGVKVILEVPHDADIDPSHIMKFASNAGFSIAVIPPSTEDYVEDWGVMCSRFVEFFLKTPNFTSHLYPVQGYLSYLIVEKLGDVKALEPTDAYVIDRFTSKVPVEWSDKAKQIMRAKFCEILGGEQGITDFIMSIMAAIAQEADKIIMKSSTNLNE
jgi:hypothetical protein